MCAWVKGLAPAWYGHLRAGSDRLIRFSPSLKVTSSGTCRRITMYQVSKPLRARLNDSGSLFTSATTMRTKHSLAVRQRAAAAGWHCCLLAVLDRPALGLAPLYD